MSPNNDFDLLHFSFIEFVHCDSGTQRNPFLYTILVVVNVPCNTNQW